MNIARLSALSLILAIAVVTLGTSVNSWAGPDVCKGKKSLRPPECGTGGDDGGSDGKAEFSVVVSGLSLSSPDPSTSLSDHPWWTGSKHGIGEADPYKDALENFDASRFITDDASGYCFGDSNTVQEASIRERRGAMESMFWFRGETNHKNPDDRDTVTYILHMGGVLTAGGDFPPAPLGAISMMAMDPWRINVANGQSDVEPSACDASSGEFLGDDRSLVYIDVKAET